MTFPAPVVPTVESMNPDREVLIAFIRQGEAGPFLIHISDDRKVPLDEFQEGSPEELRLLMCRFGPRAEIERKYRVPLLEYHIRGEWFEATDAVLSFIQKVKAWEV